MLLALAAVGGYALCESSLPPRGVDRRGRGDLPRSKRHTWTMPPLALLERPVWSPGRKAAMLVLRGYLVVAVLLLVVKTVQLGH